MTDASEKQGTALDPHQVRAYLRENPGFLSENSDLLSSMAAPERPAGEGIADFQKYMVERLRREGEELKAQQGEIIANARANMNTLNRVHSAILFLLDARSFEDFINAMTTDLAVLLDVDAAILAVESNELSLPQIAQHGVRVVPQGTCDAWLGNRPTRLNGNIAGDPQIFGPVADLVQSQVMVRLDIDPRMPQAMLVLGSRNPEIFDPSQGSELAQFMGRVIERQLRHWLQI